MQIILIQTNGLAKSRLYDIGPGTSSVGRRGRRSHRNDVGGWLGLRAQGPRIGIDEPSGAIKARRANSDRQALRCALGRRARRVQEATVSYIDSDVRIGARQRIEEHQVAGLELRACNRFAKLSISSDRRGNGVLRPLHRHTEPTRCSQSRCRASTRRSDTAYRSTSMHAQRCQTEHSPVIALALPAAASCANNATRCRARELLLTGVHSHSDWRMRANNHAARLGCAMRIVVAFDLRTAIKNLRVPFGDPPVQRHKIRLHVAARPGLRIEVMKRIDAAHQGRTVLAGDLRNTRRDIPDRKADTPVIRRIGRRAVHQSHMMQRNLAGP